MNVQYFERDLYCGLVVNLNQNQRNSINYLLLIGGDHWKKNVAFLEARWGNNEYASHAIVDSKSVDNLWISWCIKTA